MKTLDEVIDACENSVAWLCFDCTLGYCDNNDCFIADALHYLKAYKMLSQGLTSENVVWDENGIYCKSCGTRLDRDLEIEDGDEDIG